MLELVVRCYHLTHKQKPHSFNEVAFIYLYYTHLLICCLRTQDHVLAQTCHACQLLLYSNVSDSNQ